MLSKKWVRSSFVESAIGNGLKQLVFVVLTTQVRLLECNEITATQCS